MAMIGRLVGYICEKQPPALMIDVNGVGYEVLAPMSTFYELPADQNEKVVLYTHLSVREDAHQLFAFSDLLQRKLFRILIKVNGVGPKLALAILSGMSVSEFVSAVKHGDSAMLVRLPGVGKKTAERLLIEMADKVRDVQAPSTDVELNQPSSIQPSSSNDRAQMIEDALSALVALGYKPAEAEKCVKNVGVEAGSSQELIRLALQLMVKK
tara:strand:- start:2207 stop:2839 length:633 start_codon:yes stop_codon:yes gene_type:complete